MDRRLSDQAVEYFREVGAEGGRIGGKKRLITMTPAQRSAVARKAAAARWGNKTTPFKQQSPLLLPAGEEGIGQGAAAEQNRRAEARRRIIQALDRLAIPFCKWPGCVQVHVSRPNERLEYRQLLVAPNFQPPVFDRLHQSPKAWTKLADEAWQKHRDRFLKRCDMWTKAGLDEAIVPAKGARGTGGEAQSAAGQRKRGNNTPFGRRDKWAAKYLVGIALKEIAAQDSADPSTVGRVVRGVLRVAAWEKQDKALSKISKPRIKRQ